MKVLDFVLSMFGSSPFEWIAVVFGIASVYLSVRENVWSWPTGIINVSMYVVIFLEAKLYADMGLQVFYIVISFYGWWNWLYGGANHSELHITRLSRRLMAILPVAGVLGSLALGWFLHQTTDAALPYVDSTLTVASLIAQYLMTRKVLENWIIWVTADVAYIGMYIYKELYPTAFLYAVFLVLASMGWFEWKRSWQRQPAEGLAAS
ncbi:MAG TPA: nicotinamide riboside transporter PnuC [Longimicrobium sp.]|nr:nicotinamide riboside transporter PnuC [Longimicrobium sp.]